MSDDDSDAGDSKRTRRDQDPERKPTEEDEEETTAIEKETEAELEMETKDTEYEHAYTAALGVHSWNHDIPSRQWYILMDLFVLGAGNDPKRRALKARWEERIECIKHNLLDVSIHTRVPGTFGRDAMEHAFEAMEWTKIQKLPKSKGKSMAMRSCRFSGVKSRLHSMTINTVEGQTRSARAALVPPGSDHRNEVFIVQERYILPLQALILVLHIDIIARRMRSKLNGSTTKTQEQKKTAWTTWSQNANKSYNEACAHLREFFMFKKLHAT
jgi:hypothetical protein